MTREEAVNYLNGYLTAASRREFFLEMAEESGLDEFEKKAERESLAMQDILETIGGMQAESEKRVLFYRFVKGLKTAEIAEKMCYSTRQVQRLCVAGLDLLAAEKG